MNKKLPGKIAMYAGAVLLAGSLLVVGNNYETKVDHLTEPCILSFVSISSHQTHGIIDDIKERCYYVYQKEEDGRIISTVSDSEFVDGWNVAGVYQPEEDDWICIVKRKDNQDIKFVSIKTLGRLFSCNEIQKYENLGLLTPENYDQYKDMIGNSYFCVFEGDVPRSEFDYYVSQGIVKTIYDPNKKAEVAYVEVPVLSNLRLKYEPLGRSY